jgi:hypothetical protein
MFSHETDAECPKKALIIVMYMLVSRLYFAVMSSLEGMGIKGLSSARVLIVGVDLGEPRQAQLQP